MRFSKVASWPMLDHIGGPERGAGRELAHDRLVVAVAQLPAHDRIH